MTLRNKVLLSILIMIAIALTNFSVVNAENFIYKPGDWITYRYSIAGSFTDTNVNVSCSFKIRVEVINIEDTTVTYKFSLSEVETEDQICQSIGQGVRPATRSVNTAGSTPESVEIFIDPSYSGKYDISYGKVEYYKGVLKSVEGESYGAQIKITIVDSSIGELSYIGTSVHSLLVVLIIVGVLVAVVAAAAIILLHKIRKTQPTPPSPPLLSTAPI